MSERYFFQWLPTPMYVYMLVWGVVLSPLPSEASLIYMGLEEGGDSRIVVPAYSLRFYQKHVNESHIAIVDLKADSRLFDWCDLHTYNEGGVNDLLRLHNVNQSMQWAALLPSQAYCDTMEWTDLTANYILTWEHTMAPFIQNLGAAGLLAVENYPSFVGFKTHAGINMNTGLISDSLFKFSTTSSKYDDLKKELSGTHLAIWGVYINETHYSTMQDTLHQHRQSSLQIPFIVASIEDDYDAYEALREPGAFLYYYSRITSAACCTLCAGVVLQTLFVLRQYQLSAVEGHFNFTVLCLVSALFSSSFRFIVFLDPLTLRGLVDLELYFCSTSLADSFQVLTSASSLIVWFDLLDAVTLSLKFQYKTVQFSKLVIVRALVLFSMTAFFIVDLYYTYTVEIMQDPFVGSTIVVTLGGTAFRKRKGPTGEDNYGVYIDGFFAFLGLTLLSAVEIAMAIKVRGQLEETKKLMRGLQENGLGSGASAVSVELELIALSSSSSSASLQELDLPPPHTVSVPLPLPLPPPAAAISQPLDLLGAAVIKLTLVNKYLLISGCLVLLYSLLLLLQSSDYGWRVSNNPFAVNVWFLLPSVICQLATLAEVTLVGAVLRH